jgi:hypothetical protein
MFKVSMLSSSIARHEESYKLLKETLGLTSMLAPLVEHRGRAFGLVLEHQSGWKIVWVTFSISRNNADKQVLR